MKLEAFDPSRHSAAIESYMQRTPVTNNRTAKSLRLNEYDGENGQLFLIVDEQGEIRATSSVLAADENGLRVAKIYGRFHIEPGVPHSLIDRYFEAATFQWCEQRGIEHLYFTVNQGHLRVLQWICRRVGEHGHLHKKNPFHPDILPRIRHGFRPHARMIYERHCWQYVIYYSPDNRFFLHRPEAPLDRESLQCFTENFCSETQNWAELFADSENAQG